MFVLLGDSIGWIPLVLRLPLLGLFAVMALVVVVKLATVVLSVISTVLSILIPWK